MNSADDSIRFDEWLDHARALRALAGSLVRDEHDVDDLVQETWLRAVRADESRGPWLRQVLRNLVRDRWRERARRGSTERAAARPELVPSSAEIVERLEIAQSVAREVVHLAEPYRTAIHMRYFEGLSPEECARRAQVPLETVRTRLRRGLALLRQRLDRAHGGERKTWSLALAPLALREGVDVGRGGTIAAAAATGGLVMGVKLAIVGVGLVLGVTALVAWTARQRAITAASVATEEVPRTVPLVAEDDGGRGELSEDPRAMRAEIAPSAEPVAPEVEGRVVIVDADERELTHESGVLGIVTWITEADAERREVPFEDGRWHTRIAPGASLAVMSLRARDRDASLPEPRPLAMGSDPIVVRGRWFARGRLRVVDAVSRQDLGNVEVRCGDGWRANPEWTHPGDDARVKTVVARGRSPIDLPDRTRLTPYWVHAPGHAWARVDFDHRAGGERTLELAPDPSVVVVSVTGDLPDGAIVRLYPVGQRTAAVGEVVMKRPPLDTIPSWLASVSVRALRDGPTTIEDLGEGEYLATVEVGEYDERIRIGEARVSARAGETANVTVTVDAKLVDVPRTHLFGTLRAPDGLDRAACSLRLTRLDRGEKEFGQRLIEMSTKGADRQTLHWDAGMRRTGTYLAQIQGTQYRQLIEATRAGGDTRVAIEIPPLVTVHVELADVATGAAVVAERVVWSPGELPGVGESTNSKLFPDPRTGALQFVAPQGEVRVSAWASGYEEGNVTLQLSGAEATCRLELRRMTAIHVVFRDGDAVLPDTYESAQQIRVTDVDGNPVQARVRARPNETGLTLSFPAPGRYTVQFQAFDGFEAIPTRTVDVRADEVVDIVVNLQRRH